MDLTNEQKAQVGTWVGEGLSLSDIQKRLTEELGLNMTFMEVRFLVGDLDLELKDKAPKADSDLSKAPPPAPAPAHDDEPLPFPGMDEDEGVPATGGAPVSVTLDKLQRPGAVLSGSVTFSDGKTMDWQLDQMGRLGLIPRSDTADYQPSEGDLTEFQMALQQELQRSGRIP